MGCVREETTHFPEICVSQVSPLSHSRGPQPGISTKSNFPAQKWEVDREGGHIEHLRAGHVVMYSPRIKGELRAGDGHGDKSVCVSESGK